MKFNWIRPHRATWHRKLFQAFQSNILRKCLRLNNYHSIHYRSLHSSLHARNESFSNIGVRSTDLNNLKPNNSYFEISATLTNDGILFEQYPFWPSSVRSNPLLLFDQMKQIIVMENDDGDTLSEIRTNHDEIIFLRNKVDSKFVEYLKLRGIPIIERKVNLWEDITEPFLDTSVPTLDDKKPQILTIYSQMSPKDLDFIYSVISEPLFAYNFETMLWESVSLDLFDVFCSLDKNCPLCVKPLGEKEFKQFYNFANKITIQIENSVA
ncbi:hypothetical protein FDP41_001099 [Naegleria fowleri]|uniref:Uncharacterized protein n=1 Tax=Naegleria fowleri TaxID=5763 RepID=A0A6A5BX73_NAEFO|nr:uncharacterized protein FDP41_001099 [Naegleria fowleri]KAF0979946.1 hypothetical protein FDP41_001099 [Naegleria fowleri]CAG4708956.1 unnamed protein product [Naegleria fowleri]